jgi:hypothetical protein
VNLGVVKKCYEVEEEVKKEVKIKVKLSHYKPWRCLAERRYSSYSFLTSTLAGVNGQRHDLAALYPLAKDPRYPLDRRLDGPQSRSGHRIQRKNPFPLPGIEPRPPGHPLRRQTLY